MTKIKDNALFKKKSSVVYFAKFTLNIFNYSSLICNRLNIPKAGISENAEECV